MYALSEIIEQYANEIAGHRKWLRSFDGRYTIKWERLLKADPEAAICEAATSELLRNQGVTVEPNEHMSLGGPDYVCRCDNYNFYVEATCMEKAGDKSGLTHGSVYTFSSLTKPILDEIRNKTRQCSSLDAPCVLAIGTLDDVAGHICFSKIFAGHILTGTPKISPGTDAEQRPTTDDLHWTTDLEDSGFVRPNRKTTNSIEEARRTVSAVLLCSFGTTPLRAIGLLHPNPNHNFDRTLLPKIDFCRLAEGYQTGQFKVEWI